VTTKYANARDTAGQWKSELRKVQRENRSLRKVYAAARDLYDELSVHAMLTGDPIPWAVKSAAYDLKVALRGAVFAEQPKEST
jgi:hypothetical protein